MFILCVSTLGTPPASTHKTGVVQLPGLLQGSVTSSTALILPVTPAEMEQVLDARPRLTLVVSITWNPPFCKDSIIIPTLQLRQMRLEDEMSSLSPHGHSMPEPRMVHALGSGCTL